MRLRHESTQVRGRIEGSAGDVLGATTQRSPSRVLGGPQPGLLATNPHYRKGA